MALGSTACPADHTSPAVRPLLAPGRRHGCRVHAVPATWMGHPCRIRGAGARGEPESPVTGILWERRGTKGTGATAAVGSPRNPSHPPGRAVRHGWLVRGVCVLGHQPGQLRVDLAHHCPDGGYPRRQGRRIRALAVGVELVDGLGHAPESGLVDRTHHRRLSARRRPRACFGKPGYPQLPTQCLWIKIVDHRPENPP